MHDRRLPSTQLSSSTGENGFCETWQDSSASLQSLFSDMMLQAIMISGSKVAALETAQVLVAVGSPPHHRLPQSSGPHAGVTKPAVLAAVSVVGKLTAVADAESVAAQLAAERKRLASLNRFFACVPHGC